MTHHRPTPPRDLRSCVRNCQLLSFAIINGAIVVLCIMVFMQQSGDEAANWEFGPFAMIAVAMGVSGLIASFVVPQTILSHRVKDLAGQLSSQKRDDSSRTPDSRSELQPQEQQMLAEYQRSLITGLALLEGPVVLGAVLFLVSNSLICIAPGLVLIGAMMVKFPTIGRVSDWMEQTIRNSLH